MVLRAEDVPGGGYHPREEGIQWGGWWQTKDDEVTQKIPNYNDDSCSFIVIYFQNLPPATTELLCIVGANPKFIPWLNKYFLSVCPVPGISVNSNKNPSPRANPGFKGPRAQLEAGLWNS